MELNRARTVGIVLSKFSKRMSNEEIIKAIATHNEQLLSPDDLQALANALPNESERNETNLFLSRNPVFKGNPQGQLADGRSLSIPDQFIVECLTELNLEIMLESFLFKLQFPEDVAHLEESMLSIRNACTFLKGEKDLKVLLATVLNLGNLMNYEYGARKTTYQTSKQAVGFRLDSLPKLRDVKSRDGKTTLMQYLVSSVFTNQPELLNISERFAFLKQLRHIKTEDLDKSLKRLKVTFGRLRNYRPPSGATASFEQFDQTVLQLFLQETKETLDRLERASKTVQEVWKETATYFGEEVAGNDADGKKPEDLFLVLDHFFQLFDEAVAVERRNREREKREKEKAVAPKVVRKKKTVEEAPSILSVRDQMLQEIKDRTPLVAPSTSISPQMWLDEDEKQGECSECGLPIARCDCSF